MNDKALKKIDDNYYQNNRNRLETQIQELNGSRNVVSRQSISLLGAITALGIAIALLLAVTGALAPLGIVFAASAVSYGMIAAVAFSIAAVGFVAKMISSEQFLFEVRQDLAKNNRQEKILANLITEFKQNYPDLVSLEAKKEEIAKYIMVHDLDDNAFSLLCKSCLEKDATLLDRIDSSASLIEEQRAPSATKLPNWRATPPASPDHEHGLRVFDRPVPDLDIIDELAPDLCEMPHSSH